MKLCFLASAESIHSLKWVLFFHKLGYEVTWISLARSEFVIPSDITYFEIIPSDKVFGLIKCGLLIRDILKKIEPDLLHVHSVGSYGAVSLFSPSSISTVVTPWGSDIIFGKKNILKKFFIKRCLQRAAVVTCDALHMKKEILQIVPGAIDKIKIINFGIDTQRFCKGSEDCGTFLFPFKTRSKIVLSTRNFESVYDLETLIKAIPLVRSLGGEVHFVLVGSGSQQEYLTRMCEELGVVSEVCFLGRVPNDDLVKILSAADVYVSTSLSDAGIAASSAEAMSCALPVVLSNTGENNQWISHGENGFLFPAGDQVELAHTLLKVLQLPLDDQIELGNRARQTILDRNDFDTEMEKVNALYQAILN